MKQVATKILLISTFLLFISSNLNALELYLRTGPSTGLNDKWHENTQYKFGINLASTKKGPVSGFYSSTSIDFSFFSGSQIVWLIPEFQYDIKLGKLPLYIYPKLGLLFIFA